MRGKGEERKKGVILLAHGLPGGGGWMGAAELLNAAGRLTTLTESSGAAAATAWHSHI